MNFYRLLFQVLYKLRLAIIAFFILSCGGRDKDVDTVINDPAHGLWDVKITFRKALSIGVGEGDESQEFYRPRDIAIDNKGNIYVLDAGNGRIQVFDRNGKFRFSFGKSGKGPGELSPLSRTLHFLNDGNLYLLDNGNQRVTVFDADGKYLYSFQVKEYIDDIEMDSRGYLLISNFLLTESHKPIRRYKREGKFISSFGSIEEPGNDLIGLADKGVISRTILSFNRMTNIALDSNNNIYLSQKNPYLIKKYNSKGRLILKFTRKVPFITLNQLAVETGEDYVRHTIKPSTIIGQIAVININNEEIIAVPIFSPKRDSNFIDFYNTNGRLLCTAHLSLQIDEPPLHVVSTKFDRENNLYCLYTFEEGFPKVIKYSMKIR